MREIRRSDSEEEAGQTNVLLLPLAWFHIPIKNPRSAHWRISDEYLVLSLSIQIRLWGDSVIAPDVPFKDFAFGDDSSGPVTECHMALAAGIAEPAISR